MDNRKEFLDVCNSELAVDEWVVRYIEFIKALRFETLGMNVNFDSREYKTFIAEFGANNGFEDVIEEANRRRAMLGVGSLEELEL